MQFNAIRVVIRFMSDDVVYVDGYAVEVDGEPGAYGVVFPACPGCCAMGDTVDAALGNAAEALRDWLSATNR